jgi:hypothetical protein
LASFRHAARLTTEGILAAKQPRRNLARSLPLRFWLFACCRQASRAALTSSRDGRRPNAKPDVDGAAEDIGGRGTGDGGDAGNVDDGGGAGGVAGGCAAGASDAAGGAAEGSVADCATAGHTMAWCANTSAASVTATIPKHFMSGASP